MFLNNPRELIKILKERNFGPFKQKKNETLDILLKYEYFLSNSFANYAETLN